ncbi:MAG: hypothetical protein M1816_001445 [Peltula sp. TS41687]|nr:MAG: hypothetical protein M1816_001445 [Peltula sp. TS41687]
MPRPKPRTRANGAPDEAFETDDATIRITRIGSIDPTQQQHVIGLELAKDQWGTFYNFKAGNRTVDQVASTLSKLQARIDDISEAAKPPELNKIMMLMDSLGPTFEVTKKILSATEDLTYAKALARGRTLRGALGLALGAASHGRSRSCSSTKRGHVDPLGCEACRCKRSLQM